MYFDLCVVVSSIFQSIRVPAVLNFNMSRFTCSISQVTCFRSEIGLAASIQNLVFFVVLTKSA